MTDIKKALTFLEHVGQDIAKGFAKAAPIVEGAEPYISLAFPGFGPLFASIANEVISVEQKFAAVGKQTGSGADKLASVLGVIQPVAQQILGSANLPNDAATITRLVTSAPMIAPTVLAA